MRPARMWWRLVATMLFVVGCSGAPTNLAEGARCVRSTQCAVGLACNMGVCTSDLDGFGMGTVPSADAGGIDAAVEIDAGEPIDSGTPVETDAGPPGMDSGPPDEPDAGPPDEPDAGPPDEPDAGPPDEPDAGPPDEIDAGGA
ncbi:hypothetical protein [Sandaracinus amylolyticus]|uniref:hypothetical protein n=1 Tax=Sandaracinus amylolyticus TaxID=927083 RepID=UPI001F1A0FC9|nr:hypothetical protein [Sandaracinus amylolyticus]